MKITHHDMTVQEENIEIKSSTNTGYVCTNCGIKVKELYKKYTPSILKLINCEICEAPADKYIEFETIITLIDVILLSKPAYRHILYNTSFRNHWKLFVVLLLIESYYLWTEEKDNGVMQEDTYIEEKNFYFWGFKIILETLVLYTILRIIILLTSSEKAAGSKVWKALTITNCSKFLLLPIMIWRENLSDNHLNIHLLLMLGYYSLSLVQTYASLVNCSNIWAALMISIALVLRSMIMTGLLENISTFIAYFEFK